MRLADNADKLKDSAYATKKYFSTGMTPFPSDGYSLLISCTESASRKSKNMHKLMSDTRKNFLISNFPVPLLSLEQDAIILQGMISHNLLVHLENPIKKTEMADIVQIGAKLRRYDPLFEVHLISENPEQPRPQAGQMWLWGGANKESYPLSENVPQDQEEANPEEEQAPPQNHIQDQENIAVERQGGFVLGGLGNFLQGGLQEEPGRHGQPIGLNNLPLNKPRRKNSISSDEENEDPGYARDYLARTTKNFVQKRMNFSLDDKVLPGKSTIKRTLVDYVNKPDIKKIKR